MASLRLPVLRRFTLDGALFIGGFVFVVYSLTGHIEPFRQGFWCHDPTIQHKHPEVETVSTKCLLATTLLVPLFTVLLLEAVHVNNCISAKSLGAKSRLKRCLRSWAKVYFTFLFGHMFLILIVEIAKLAMGELRPHFMDTCKPLFKDAECTQGPMSAYVTNFTCASLYSKAAVSDAFKSFPSGHAALSFYSAIFLVVYMQLQKQPWPSKFTRFALQFALAGLAIYCSVTRITDRRHHWWDALAGAISGIVVGLFMGLSQWSWADCKVHKLSSMRHIVMATVTDEAQSRSTSQVVINHV